MGAKQGEPMNPILFNIYLNDLSDKIAGIDNNSPNINGVNFLLYADDLTLLSTSSNDLQNKLDKLKSYCDDWKLTLNLSKTKVIEFNKTGRQSKYAFHFMKTTLKHVNHIILRYNISLKKLLNLYIKKDFKHFLN